MLFVIQRIPRYDIKGKEILQTNEKYFVSDLSLIYSHVMGYRDRLIGGMLENLVCMELKRRGYEVYVGKQDEKEVDFVAIGREEKVYIQVTYQLGSQATIDREFAPPCWQLMIIIPNMWLVWMNCGRITLRGLNTVTWQTSYSTSGETKTD